MDETGDTGRLMKLVLLDDGAPFAAVAEVVLDERVGLEHVGVVDDDRDDEDLGPYHARGDVTDVGADDGAEQSELELLLNLVGAAPLAGGKEEARVAALNEALRELGEDDFVEFVFEPPVDPVGAEVAHEGGGQRVVEEAYLGAVGNGGEPCVMDGPADEEVVHVAGVGRHEDEGSALREAAQMLDVALDADAVCEAGEAAAAAEHGPARLAGEGERDAGRDQAGREPVGGLGEVADGVGGILFAYPPELFEAVFVAGAGDGLGQFAPVELLVGGQAALLHAGELHMGGLAEQRLDGVLEPGGRLEGNAACDPLHNLAADGLALVVEAGDRRPGTKGRGEEV